MIFRKGFEPAAGKNRGSGDDWAAKAEGLAVRWAESMEEEVFARPHVSACRTIEVKADELARGIFKLPEDAVLHGYSVGFLSKYWVYGDVLLECYYGEMEGKR